MSYLDLPPIVRMVYAVISIITYIISITDLIRSWSTFKDKIIASVPAALTLLSALLFQIYAYSVDIFRGCEDENPIKELFDVLVRMPAAGFGALVLGTLVVSSVAYIVTSQKINTRITLRSIRDGFNSINTGVLMYKEGGFLLLANSIMEQISLELTGKLVTNGENFRKLMESMDNHVVLRDGTIYLIKANELVVDGMKVNELTASDVTAQTLLRKEVRQLESEKKAFNKRLTEYSQRVDEVTIKKEILNTKIDVHGEMGNALLLSKSYLNKDKSAPDKETLKSMWHKAIMFKGTSPVEREDRFSNELYEAAKVCGIALTINGTIPSQEKTQIRKILATATREAIINASRHASADKMELYIDHKDGDICFDFTNNGKAPEKFSEGGGLSSLRQLVEDNKGTMEVLSSPQFSIIIRLPEG